MGWNDSRDVNVLLGKTLVSIDVADDEMEILFKTKDGETYKMFHDQD